MSVLSTILWHKAWYTAVGLQICVECQMNKCQKMSSGQSTSRVAGSFRAVISNFAACYSPPRAFLIAQRWRIHLQCGRSGRRGGAGLIPGWGKSARRGNSNPPQCSCLENPMDSGAWWAAVYGVAESLTWLKWLNTITQEGIRTPYSKQIRTSGSESQPPIRFIKLSGVFNM